MGIVGRLWIRARAHLRRGAMEAELADEFRFHLEMEAERLVRAEGLTYGQFIHALKLAHIDLVRKVLADIAMHEAEAFSAIIAQAKAALPKEDAKAA